MWRLTEEKVEGRRRLLGSLHGHYPIYRFARLVVWVSATVWWQLESKWYPRASNRRSIHSRTLNTHLISSASTVTIRTHIISMCAWAIGCDRRSDGVKGDSYPKTRPVAKEENEGTRRRKIPVCHIVSIYHWNLCEGVDACV